MNKEPISIKIKDYTVLPIAVDSEEGEKVHSEIIKHFAEGKDVTIDFGGIDVVNTAFLNTAVGQLYKDYTSEYLNSHLNILINKGDLDSLKLVIERAKEFFKDSDSFNQSVTKILGDE